MAVEAIRNHILFQFEEKKRRQDKMDQFAEVTDWGFEVTRIQDSMDQPRWGIVVAVGPDVIEEAIVPGARILIDALKWTNAVEFGGNEYWRTDEDNVLGIDDDHVVS